MIEEFGSVVELKGKHIAVVVAEKSTFCKHCASMEHCNLGTDNRTMVMEAENSLGASVGDRVKIVTSSKHFLQSSFILYIVPLLALLVGGILGHVVGERMEGGPDPDLLSAVIGTAFLVASFFIIRVATRAIPRDNYLPRIVEILPEEDALVRDLNHGN